MCRRNHVEYSLLSNLKSVSDLGKDYIQPNFERYWYIEKEGEKADCISYWAKYPMEVFLRQVINIYKIKVQAL